MIEIENDLYAAVQLLGKDLVMELARGLVRARHIHPRFADDASHAAEVVNRESIELVASVFDKESVDRQKAEAMDTAITALRFWNTEWLNSASCSPVETSEGVSVTFDADDDFEGLREAPETLFGYMEQTAQEAPADLVNHPPHYTAGAIECIDAIKAALTPEEFAGYCKGNLIKYTWRERHKGGLQSLEKGMWYLQRLIDNYPGGGDVVE